VPLSPNMRAALFMSISMASFTVNDAITKSLTVEMNLGQIAFVRGFFATILIGSLALYSGALRELRSILHPMVALRVLGELGSTVSFLTALSHMPLANVSAVLQSLPLAVTMGAALFMGEPVGWRRWIAIAVGFAGVLIIVRPGVEGFDSYSLYALACVLSCAIRDLATRRVPPAIPSLFISTATASCVGLFGALLIVPMGGWSPMPVESTAMLALAAVLVVIGYQFIIMSMRLGDISFVAPFRYTALIWAILLSAVFFGDFPDAIMLAGAALVVGSGLYTLYRERVRGAHRPAAESTTPAMAPDGT